MFLITLVFSSCRLRKILVKIPVAPLSFLKIQMIRQYKTVKIGKGNKIRKINVTKTYCSCALRGSLKYDVQSILHCVVSLWDVSRDMWKYTPSRHIDKSQTSGIMILQRFRVTIVGRNGYTIPPYRSIAITTRLRIETAVEISWRK